MKIVFTCPSCRSLLKAPGTALGVRVDCPQCRHTTAVPRTHFAPQTRIGNFEITRFIGLGGMGEVYAAKQLSLDREVAVKILPAAYAGQPEAAQRFLKEVRVAARLQHPNIVTAYDAGEDDGLLFMAMSLVRGLNLHDHLREHGPMSERKALALVRKMADALDYAWRRAQVIHRDIKPANILLDERGEPRLADMGLSKSLTDKEGITLSGMVMGTPNYMSPEQTEGRSDLDFRADIYSLGATLYHILTGQVPFAGSSVLDVLRKQVTEELPDPRDFNPEVSEACVNLLQAMLAKKAEHRHPDWPALIRDIDLVLRGRAGEWAPPRAGDSVVLRRGLAAPPRKIVVPKGAIAPPRPTTRPPRPPGAPPTPASPVAAPGPPQSAVLSGRRRLILWGGGAGLGVAALLAAALALRPGCSSAAGRHGGGAASAGGTQQLAAVIARLKELNPGYDGGETHTVENGRVTELRLHGWAIARLEPVAELTALRTLECPAETATGQPGAGRGKLRDLSPLRGRALTAFDCAGQDVSDLWPLADAPLARLTCRDTPVRDLSPLRHMPLESLRFDPALARTARNREILVGLASLATINDLPAAEFWKQVDAGRLPAASVAAPSYLAGGDPEWRDAVDLMALIDVAKDQLSGTWAVRPGELLAADAARVLQMLQPPYRPPEEYDYRVSFTPKTGTAEVAVGLTAAGRSFAFCLKRMADDHCLGFEAIGGKAVASGPTARRIPHLELGRRYTVVVQVRRQGLRAYLDGAPVAEWATDYRDLSAWPVWVFRDASLPGIGCSLSTVVFHELKLREVTGKGTQLRGGVAAAAAPTVPAAAASGPAVSAALPSHQTIDVLALVDPTKDRITIGGGNPTRANAWERRSGSLVYLSDGGSGKLAAPVAIRARSYEIEVEFTRLSGPGRLHVDLPLEDGRIIPMYVDKAGAPLIANAKGPLWPADRSGPGRVAVRMDRGTNGMPDRVSVVIDDRIPAEWQGDLAQFAKVPEPYPHFPRQPLPSLYCHADGYEIRAWRLRVFDGEAIALRGVPAADDAFLREVAALPAEQQVAQVMAKLKELNPGFDPAAAQERHTVETGAVVTLAMSSIGISNLSPVRALGRLRELEMIGERTKEGVVTRRGSIRDLSPLAGLKLTKLVLLANQIEDLAPLRGMPLTFLHCDCNPGIASLEPLAGMPLTTLYCTETRVTDLSPVKDSRLMILGIENTRVADLSPLAALPLNYLYMRFSPIRDFAPLRKTPLRVILFSPAPGLDLAPLRDLASLQSINNLPAAEFWKKAEPEAAAGAAQGARTLDLLPLIDPRQDALTGTWTRVDGGLMSDLTFVSRVETPYAPPEEYDFRICFTRLSHRKVLEFSGWGDTTMLLQKDGQPFMWYMGAHGNTWFGFDLVGGLRFDRNPTGVRTNECLQLNRRYTAVVSVRKGSVRAFLDGRLISEWRPEMGALSPGPYSTRRDGTLLGLAACNVQTVFHSAEVVEVTGRGRFTRAAPVAPADASAAEAAFMRDVAALPAEQQVARVVARLAELHPGFDGKEQHALVDGRVTTLKFSGTHLTNLAPVRALASLREFTCSYDFDLRDLSPLRGMPLTVLDCNFTSVADFSPLKGMPLRRLHAACTRVTDLSPLVGLPLEYLSCDKSPVADLTPLATLPLKQFICDLPRALEARNREVLRGLATLQTIKYQPAPTFWKGVDDGVAGYEPNWTNAVDLLPLIELPRDAGKGVWTRDNGELVSGRDYGARVEIPYQPPEEYDFRMVFTRREGAEWVFQTLSRAGQAFVWLMGCNSNTLSGFDWVGERQVMENLTGLWLPLETGRRHTSVVQVRRDGLRVYVDGQLVFARKTDYTDMRIRNEYVPRDARLLGVGSWHSPTVFHRLEVREVTGKGAIVRAAAAPST